MTHSQTDISELQDLIGSSARERALIRPCYKSQSCGINNSLTIETFNTQVALLVCRSIEWQEFEALRKTLLSLLLLLLRLLLLLLLLLLLEAFNCFANVAQVWIWIVSRGQGLFARAASRE